MTDSEHRELAAALNSLQSRVAISNYACELMEELYPAPKWRKFVAPEKTIHSTKGKRAEVLWTNYDP
jgi:DNA adenine methylase